MAQLSPGVLVKEIDQSQVVPGVATSSGAMVGTFSFGPADVSTLVTSENNLRDIFHTPNDSNFTDWFSAANFLSYSTNLRVVRAVSTTAFNSSITVTNDTASLPETGTVGLLIKNEDAFEASPPFLANRIIFSARFPGILGNSIKVAWTDNAGFATWAYASNFNQAPVVGNIHVIVLDATGNITGTAEAILETFIDVSLTAGDKKFDGTNNFYKDRIQSASRWIWAGDQTLLTADSDGVTMGSGSEGATTTDGERQIAYDLFKSEEEDISLIFMAGGSSTVGKYIIDNIAEVRKDVVAFVSPDVDDVVNVGNTTTILSNLSAVRTSYGSSSYAFMDSQWKYQYDRYNDINRWVPMNADMAGLCANTDRVSDPWFSPAGQTRGVIRNITRLSFKQDKSFRDEIYKQGINPVVSQPGVGFILFGDKTLQTTASAFDRINVRRLFITVEKAISQAARAFLFEQNDDLTRAQFTNVIEPFLRDVQGRRGITDFKVVITEANNPPQVIDNNELVGDIFIAPTRSINFIQLNFVATRTGTNFDEIGG